jgi:hypothetical protein
MVDMDSIRLSFLVKDDATLEDRIALTRRPSIHPAASAGFTRMNGVKGQGLRTSSGLASIMSLYLLSCLHAAFMVV